jgi:hypothetical protein
MSSEKGVLASGLEPDSQSTRRRNVPSTSANGGMVNRVEVDDKKEQVKKVSIRLQHKLGRALFHRTVLTCPFSIEGTIITRIPRRMGISDRTANFHRIRVLYAAVQDWSVPDCYLG